MSEWIDKLHQEMQSEEDRRNQIRRVLPVKAEQFWDGLCETLRQDVRTLSSVFGDKVGQIHIKPKSLYSLVIERVGHTDYGVTLTFDKPASAIRIVCEKADERSSNALPPLNVTFELDDNDKLIAKTPQRTGIDAAYLSEVILKPFVRGAQNPA